MSGSQFKPWSDNPNAPKIPYLLYFQEKANFAGIFMASILYGMLVVLFFKCMSALFNPIYRRGEGINWGLVSFTVVMFSLATVCTTMNLDINSISYIDNREYPGGGGTAPGPLGYIATVFYKAINIVPNTAFVLNNWLADGLLLYRCYVVYSMNLWVIAFPCFMYLASVATGILMVYPIGIRADGSVWSILPYFSISLSLNVILTLMIVVRLILHNKEVGATTELPAGKNGLYKTVVTMLVESSALYAVSSLLVIGPLAAGSPAMDMFSPVLALTQVIAPLLIVRRVANKSALTSDSIALESIGSFRARSRGEFTSGSDPLPGGHHMGFAGELGVGDDSVTDIDRGKV